MHSNSKPASILQAPSTASAEERSQVALVSGGNRPPAVNPRVYEIGGYPDALSRRRRPTHKHSGLTPREITMTFTRKNKHSMEDISDFTEAEFISFVKDIRVVNKGGTADELGELLERFSNLAGHPDGYDLIFHPEPGADHSAEGVTETVKQWRKAQGLPGFKND